MSTRCQVKVIQEGMNDWREEVTLYHHYDGYPKNMIPVINKAYNFKDKYDNDWIKGRAGKVASLLCWADPGIFEPEEGHKLHGDIEYYYKLYCMNHKEGTVNDKPTWEIEIFDGSGERLEHKRATLSELLEIYPSPQGR